MAFVLSTPCLAHLGVHEQIERLNERLRKEPRNARLFLKRGELHRIHRDWPNAKKDYEKARKLDAEIVTVDLCLGRMYVDARRPGKARSALDRFLERHPDHAVALATRARAFSLEKKHVEAARDYTRAIRALRVGGRPKPEYYMQRARELAAAGPEHVGEAIDGLDRGLRELGHVISLQLLAIELETRRANDDGALGRLDEIARRARRKETWLFRRGEILEKAGRVSCAREAYRGAREALRVLPPARRRTKAMMKLDDQIEKALERGKPREDPDTEKQGTP